MSGLLWMKHSAQRRTTAWSSKAFPAPGAASETSLVEINREKANIVTPEKWASAQLKLIGRQERFRARAGGSILPSLRRAR
jgi:hypothetical protein